MFICAPWCFIVLNSSSGTGNFLLAPSSGQEQWGGKTLGTTCPAWGCNERLNFSAQFRTTKARLMIYWLQSCSEDIQLSPSPKTLCLMKCSLLIGLKTCPFSRPPASSVLGRCECCYLALTCVSLAFCLRWRLAVYSPAGMYRSS